MHIVIAPQSLKGNALLEMFKHLLMRNMYPIDDRLRIYTNRQRCLGRILLYP